MTNSPAQDSKDLVNGFIGLVILAVLSRFIPSIVGWIALGMAFYYYALGRKILKGDDPSINTRQPQVASAANAPVVHTPTLADKMASVNIPKDLKCPSCGASIRPADKKCNYCDSSLVPLIDLPQPAYFGEVQVG